MLRVVLTIVLPLLAPTAVYVIWLVVWRQSQGETWRWAALPWIWLLPAGVVLLAAVLVLVTVHFGAPETGVYVPPRYENGHIVPSHIEPRHTQ